MILKSIAMVKMAFLQTSNGFQSGARSWQRHFQPFNTFYQFAATLEAISGSYLELCHIYI